MAVSESAACAIASTQRPIGLGSVSASAAALHPVDELGEPPGEVDRAAVDVVERQHALDEPPVLLGHRDADQHPVEAPPPRVGLERAKLERLAVRGVEPPADPALGDPFLHPRQVVVVEAEPPADRLAPGQVEQL